MYFSPKKLVPEENNFHEPTTRPEKITISCKYNTYRGKTRVDYATKNCPPYNPPIDGCPMFVPVHNF